MMAGLFLIYTIAALFTIAKQRYLAIASVLIGLVLSALMFWSHVTDKIDIRL